MKAFGAAFVSAFLLVAGSATAQVVDLSTIKCGEFVKSDKETIGYIVMWLDGYYKEKDDPPIIDFTKFQKDAARLGKYCGDNPEIGLITASDKILQKSGDNSD
ncbi:MAG: hypothetical protein JO305_05215 [Alphaproteobacteria bacterium]|nr:hypothetical protein [Alphaproteobacteria bacterium]